MVDERPARDAAWAFAASIVAGLNGSGMVGGGSGAGGGGMVGGLKRALNGLLLFAVAIFFGARRPLRLVEYRPEGYVGGQASARSADVAPKDCGGVAAFDTDAFVPQDSAGR